MLQQMLQRVAGFYRTNLIYIAAAAATSAVATIMPSILQTPYDHFSTTLYYTPPLLLWCSSSDAAP